MTIVSILERLIPAGLREPVQIFIASRIVEPVKMYVDIREDLFGRSELLVQMLEQRMIRGEQASKAVLNATVAAQREEIDRLERRMARLEQQIANLDVSSTAAESAAV